MTIFMLTIRTDAAPFEKGGINQELANVLMKLAVNVLKHPEESYTLYDSDGTPCGRANFIDE